MTRARPYRWLALVPPLVLLGGVPLANRVHAYVLGLPFLLFWMVACVLFTSGMMTLIGVLDARADRAEGITGAPPAPPRAPGPGEAPAE